MQSQQWCCASRFCCSQLTGEKVLHPLNYFLRFFLNLRDVIMISHPGTPFLSAHSSWYIVKGADHRAEWPKRNHLSHSFLVILKKILSSSCKMWFFKCKKGGLSRIASLANHSQSQVFNTEIGMTKKFGSRLSWCYLSNRWHLGRHIRSFLLLMRSVELSVSFLAITVFWFWFIWPDLDQRMIRISFIDFIEWYVIR